MGNGVRLNTEIVVCFHRVQFKMVGDLKMNVCPLFCVYVVFVYHMKQTRCQCVHEAERCLCVHEVEANISVYIKQMWYQCVCEADVVSVCT